MWNSIIFKVFRSKRWWWWSGFGLGVQAPILMGHFHINSFSSIHWRVASMLSVHQLPSIFLARSKRRNHQNIFPLQFVPVYACIVSGLYTLGLVCMVGTHSLASPAILIDSLSSSWAPRRQQSASSNLRLYSLSLSLPLLSIMLSRSDYYEWSLLSMNI